MWTLAYSTADISNVSVTAGPAATAAGKTISCSPNGTGRYVCIASGMNAAAIGSGTLASASFTIAGNTSATSTAIQISNPAAASPTGTNIGATGVGGALTVLRAVALSGVSCGTATILVAGSVQCTVSLTAPAPSGGLTVSLGSSVTGGTISLPTSVVIPAGSSSKQVTLTVLSITGAGSIQVTATALGLTKSASIAIGSSTAPALSALSCSPTTIGAPGSTTCTVSLTKAAPSAGFVANLAASAPGASVTIPASVTVPSGATSRAVTLTLNSAGSATSIQVTASASGVTRTTTVGISAPVGGISVGVTPALSTIYAGQSIQLTATVSGTTNKAVTWSIVPAMGTISSTGLYKAPAVMSTQQTMLIKAVSAADTTKSSTVMVVVKPGAAAAVPGLVAAYSFKEGSGATVNDASGNGNTGTISGAAWNTQGKHGSALSFNGTNSLVTIPASASLNVSSAMTLEAWINPAVSQSGWRTIMQREVNAWFLNASNSSGPLRPAGGGTFGGGIDYVLGPTASPVNAWTHIALTYDGSTLRLYMNGTQVSSKPMSGAIQTNSSPLRIGGNSPYGEYFNGRIDEVRVYNRALSQAEIQTDMATAIP